MIGLDGTQLSCQVLEGGSRPFLVVFGRGVVLRQVSESSFIGCIVESIPEGVKLVESEELVSELS